MTSQTTQRPSLDLSPIQSLRIRSLPIRSLPIRSLMTSVVIGSVLCFSAHVAHAQDSTAPAANSFQFTKLYAISDSHRDSSRDSGRDPGRDSGRDYHLIPEGKLVAQAEGDDAYDPFADYSEFEETADEEEDLNFFRNGRLLTVGFLGGYRGWTGTLGSLYSSGPTFGLYLCYFFDLRFALQISYVTNQTTLSVPARTNSSAVNGNINIDDLQLLLKYYFNTQNVTRGLASLNPYVVGGISQIYRTVTVSGNNNFGKDSAFGADIGAGIELPMMRNKMYFGAQGLYQVINFSDANKDYLDAAGNNTGIKGSGSSFTAMGILGINF